MEWQYLESLLTFVYKVFLFPCFRSEKKKVTMHRGLGVLPPHYFLVQKVNLLNWGLKCYKFHIRGGVRACT
jgi:hypothetical protein